MGMDARRGYGFVRKGIFVVAVSGAFFAAALSPNRLGAG